jgi:hypothetical protein
MVNWRNLFNKKQVSEPDFMTLEKKMNRMGAGLELPDDFFDGTNMDMTLGHLNDMVSPLDIYNMAMYSDILRNVIPTIRFELFRNGYVIETEDDLSLDAQSNKIEELFLECNEHQQGLFDVLEEFEDNLQIFDNGYLLAVKDYYVTEQGIVGGCVEQVVSLNPLQVRKLMDRKSRLGYDKDGNRIYFSLRDRTTYTTEQYNEFGEKNLIAGFEVTSNAGGSMYYDPNEILHVMKYRKSKRYGFSQIYSLYNKSMTLIQQDYYMKQYYSGSKVPKGILMANTSNVDSFKTAWKNFLNRSRKDPSKLQPFIHQSDGSQEVLKFISFMNNLDEMQFTQTRNEIRNNIGSLFYVSPVFNNDASAGGGLNNEGLQITVTDRGVEIGQKIYNEKVFPWLFKQQMGITTCSVKLKPSKEIDEIAEKEVRLKELSIARESALLGLEVEMEKDGSFKVREGKVEVQQQGPELGGNPLLDMFDNPEQGVQKSDFQKAVKLPKEVEQKVNSSLEKELNEVLKELTKYQNKPSKAQLKKKVGDVMKLLEKRLNKKSSTFIKKIYEEAKALVDKETNLNLPFGEQDKNVIEHLKRHKGYRKSFDKMTKTLSDNIMEVIENAYSNNNVAIGAITKELRGQFEQSESKLREIARTETSKISIAARKTQYDKTGYEYDYFWIGPNDNRTGEDSKKIKELTKNGVSWDNLIKIMQKVAGDGWEVDSIAPIPRPNTRHTFIAKRKKS